MKLARVTITGADDAVDPADLVKLSTEFPFVEWGILFSETRAGSPRYPSEAWRLGLAAIAAPRPRLALSAHLCGKIARDMESGAVPSLPTAFQRVQLNGYTGSVLTGGALRTLGVELILQAKSIDWMIAAAVEARVVNGRAHLASEERGTRASVLYDPSCGNGLEPPGWPSPPRGVPIGYAGGITPSNVLGVLDAISWWAPTPDDARPFWIDMESGVRTDDRFDLALVREVLQRCSGRVLSCRPATAESL